MELEEVIKSRFSCRKYKTTTISKSVIEKLLETCSMAPSAKNTQPWKLIVVTDPQVKESLRIAYDRDWVINAPAIIVACGLNDISYKRILDNKDFTDIDLSIIFTHISLVATNMGLATCWLGAFNETEVKKALKIPANVSVVAMTPLGYADESIRPKTRKKLEEIISWENW